MVVISSMCFVMFLLCSLLLASQRPARGDDQHATIESGSLDRPTVPATCLYKELFQIHLSKSFQNLGVHGGTDYIHKLYVYAVMFTVPRETSI